jgi:hypothetical protein
VTGREWKGSAFGGARGRTDVPKIVDWYMEGKLNIDDLITHTLPLDRINEGFDLMKAASRSARWCCTEDAAWNSFSAHALPAACSASTATWRPSACR